MAKAPTISGVVGACASVALIPQLSPRVASDVGLHIEALYRDTRIGEIYEGTNEIQKWVIARQIFGRDITG
ncbi:acyl-CoA dehydrogenase family protein [Kitasatospora sp. NPDC056531]|uniref:acyl-CoA dehydrogenase family protein n=1 Tax=Kitasatospora sp. NPDC056531 TaxID=3345856 RepID=UPI0036C8162B